MHMCEVSGLNVTSDKEVLERATNKAAFRMVSMEGTADPYEADTVNWRATPEFEEEIYKQLVLDHQLDYVIYVEGAPVAWWERGAKSPYFPGIGHEKSYGLIPKVHQKRLREKVFARVYTVSWNGPSGTLTAHYRDERDRDARIVDLIVTDKAENVRVED